MNKKKGSLRICVSSTGENLEAEIDPRFGRCDYFIIINIFDSKISDIKSIKNIGAQEEKGAGIKAAEQIGGLGVNLLITGEVGPKADEILKQLEIKILKKSGNARVAVSEYLEEGMIESESGVSKLPTDSNMDEKVIEKNQRIFIPLMDDNGEESVISPHFGHAPYFGLYDVDSAKLIIKENKLDHSNLNKTPVDQVIEQVNPTIVYARGMGVKAVDLFAEKNIILKTGPYGTAQEVIKNINKLENLSKSCDH